MKTQTNCTENTITIATQNACQEYNLVLTNLLKYQPTYHINTPKVSLNQITLQGTPTRDELNQTITQNIHYLINIDTNPGDDAYYDYLPALADEILYFIQGCRAQNLITESDAIKHAQDIIDYCYKHTDWYCPIESPETIDILNYYQKFNQDIIEDLDPEDPESYELAIPTK